MNPSKIKKYVENLLYDCVDDDNLLISRKNHVKTRDNLLKIFTNKLEHSYNKSLPSSLELTPVYNTIFMFGLLVIHHMKIEYLVGRKDVYGDIFNTSNVFSKRIEEILKSENEAFEQNPTSFSIPQNVNFYVYDDLFTKLIT